MFELDFSHIKLLYNLLCLVGSKYPQFLNLRLNYIICIYCNRDMLSKGEIGYTRLFFTADVI